MIETLAQDIANIVRDYRNEDGIQMTPNHFLHWAAQFGEHQLFILEELTEIFKKRYISRDKARQFIGVAIQSIAKKYGYNSPQSFLQNTAFLDLQRSGKSQTVMLKMLNDILLDQYHFSLSECGSSSIKNYLYLDDMMCTGNTVFYDLKRWLDRKDETGQSQLDKVREAQSNVIGLFIFTHRLNTQKLRGRFYYSYPQFNFKIYRLMEIDNDYRNSLSKLDFMFPIYDNQPTIVYDYFQSLKTDIPGVFRDQNRPIHETFFSSVENRVRFENILLKTGLEILQSVSVNKDNIRPLGFTLPSQKNLGFGTLCFTWRNIPNNTPLVFWYASPFFQPLFEKRPTK